VEAEKEAMIVALSELYATSQRHRAAAGETLDGGA
jgi:hypothetical protein